MCLFSFMIRAKKQKRTQSGEERGEERGIDKMAQTQGIQQSSINPDSIHAGLPTKQSKMATLRLKKDIASFYSDAADIDFVSLSFPDPTNILTVHIRIDVQAESRFYQGTRIDFQLNFPDSYPIDPPKVRCLQRIYHPNINHRGSICLPLVREDWLPTTSLLSIVCGLIFLLTYPNGEDALQPNIGDQLIKDPELFAKIVDHTNQGLNFASREYDCIVRRS